ncbi:MAG: Manganese transport system membrane protein MntB [bacterium ADurb.Bin478]|nr:MAG: Manganese transport system membrane protein MntB [bacterium ADurb.Bin478]
MRGYNVDLYGYIFGNILAVSRFDLYSSLILGVMVLGLIVLFYKEFLLLTFDPEMARVVGLPVRTLNLLMLTLVALTVVLSIKSVGVVLVSALIVTPAASAFLLTDDFKKMMWISVAIGVGGSWLGLFLSTWLNVASGAAIVMTVTLIFFLCFLFSPQRRRMKQRMSRLKQLIKS